VSDSPLTAIAPALLAYSRVPTSQLDILYNSYLDMSSVNFMSFRHNNKTGYFVAGWWWMLATLTDLGSVMT